MFTNAEKDTFGRKKRKHITAVKTIHCRNIVIFLFSMIETLKTKQHMLGCSTQKYRSMKKINKRDKNELHLNKSHSDFNFVRSAVLKVVYILHL